MIDPADFWQADERARLSERHNYSHPEPPGRQAPRHGCTASLPCAERSSRPEPTCINDAAIDWVQRIWQVLAALIIRRETHRRLPADKANARPNLYVGNPGARRSGRAVQPGADALIVTVKLPAWGPSLLPAATTAGLPAPVWSLTDATTTSPSAEPVTGYRQLGTVSIVRRQPRSSRASERADDREAWGRWARASTGPHSWRGGTSRSSTTRRLRKRAPTRVWCPMPAASSGRAGRSSSATARPPWLPYCAQGTQIALRERLSGLSAGRAPQSVIRPLDCGSAHSHSCPRGPVCGPTLPAIELAAAVHRGAHDDIAVTYGQSGAWSSTTPSASTAPSTRRPDAAVLAPEIGWPVLDLSPA